MNEYLTFSLTVFLSFFAVMNPIANTPIFLGVVEGKSKKEIKHIAKKSTLTAFIIVVVFVIAGKYIFQLFGITIPAFKITGGVLLFYVGFEMLMSKKSKIHNNDTEESSDSIAISPLAIPILAGPGTIVTAMNQVTDAGYDKIAIVCIVFGVMILLTYLAFILSDRILEKLGANLIAVVGKIMGLILAIIGTDMLVAGVKLAFDL
ncbi:MarC family protein [Flammeovirga yaeyamensis]|nr:MarC family protein [Flammeovirga yaeyamensis]MBB3698794.1 multiple antibiotic resistance protein [Flammeovirga yaeyamensis]NMF37379.1 MarC family protein [Flammeovirga yaeyamensis]